MANKIPKALAPTSAPRRPPEPASEGSPSATASSAPAVGSVVDRSLSGRRATAQDEVERLVAAAFQVIERTGDLEPKVSEILREAGLSNPAFYRHFRGKHELLVTVLDVGIRGLAEYLEQRMAGVDDASRAAREWIRGMAAQALDQHGARASRPFALARGRLAEHFPAEIAESERRVAAPLRAALERGRAEGTMPEVDPETESEALYHLMMGWVEARLVEGRIPEASEVGRLEAFALAGLTRASSATAASDTAALEGASVIRERSEQR